MKILLGSSLNSYPTYFIFDFDGVVCDSTNECLVTSWNAWESLRGGAQFRTGLNDFSLSEISTFQELRPRVRGAGEYYVIYRSILEGNKIYSQSDFDLAVRRHGQHLPQYAEIFHEMRKKLRALNLENWIKLHPIYKEVSVLLDECNKKNRLFIATLKDKESVKLILESCSIKINDDLIFDSALIKSKLDALQQIQKKLGCDKSDLIFIDDNAMHLLEPHRASYNVNLAAWGAKMPDYIELSIKNGIPVLEDPQDLRNLIQAK